MKRHILAVFLIFFMMQGLRSQIAGSFTVPGSFPTLAAAINTLNISGAAGAVTINVLAGYTETVPVGGLRLINPPGSGTTTILFKKNGVGSNPLLLAYAGGTAIANSAQRDGIWMLVDCRNITIDGFDLLDQNTSSPATMEYGFAFYKAGINGNQYNTIRNCVITLASPNAAYAKGIDMSSDSYLSNNIDITPTASTQTNSYNAFYNNLIQKCDVGISIRGSSNSSYLDIYNNVGGLSTATSNTILNYGGGSNPGQAINAQNQALFNASNNLINNNNGFGAVPGNGIEGIYLYGINSTINNNTITLSANAGASNPFFGIRQQGFHIGAGTISINENVFPSLTCTTAPSFSGRFFSAINTSSNSIINVYNNKVVKFTAGGDDLNIIKTAESYTTFAEGNAISGATVDVNGVIHGIACEADQLSVINNTISNLQAPATSSAAYSAIVAIGGTGQVSLRALNNTISNLQGGEVFGINFTSSLSIATFSIVSNRIDDLGVVPTTTLGANAWGIKINLPLNNGTITIQSNTLSNITGRGFGVQQNSGSVYGIGVYGGVKAVVSQNKIYNFSSNGSAMTSAIALNCSNGHIYNNLVSNLQHSLGKVEIVGITSGNYKVYYNTFCLSNTATPVGNTNISLISCNFNASMELRNNILVNTSVVTATNVASIVDMNVVSSLSNRNAYYFGTPGPYRRIMAGVPSSSTIVGFQNLSGSDAQSFIENPPFISTVGSTANFLNIDPAIVTQIESGAAVISTITTDFIGAPRSNTPDIGAWEGNFIAADASPPAIVNSGFTAPPCNGSTRTFTANITDVSGVATGSLSPRLYYRVNFGLYTSTQGSLTSGTATNGVWTFTFNYVATVGDAISFFYVLQDVSYLNNFRVVPAAGASASDVNTVPVPPNPALGYTIQTFPAISVAVTNTSICTGKSFTILASGASYYSYAPALSPIVTPATNTNYTVTGFSSQGCPSTNSVAVTVSVMPLPTITVNNGTICVGQSFTMIPNGAATYYYQGGSNPVSPLASTFYTVIGQSLEGCRSLQAISIVTVYSTNISALATVGQVCNGEPTTLNGIGGVSYAWSNWVSNNVPFTPSVTAVYTVTGTTTQGCAGTNTIEVIVHPLPNLTLSAATGTICLGETINLSVQGATNYTWEPGPVSGSVLTTPLFSTTDFTVGGVNSQGCRSTAISKVTVDLCLGIKELSENGFRLAPNPSGGEFYVYNAVTKNLSVRVTDLSGRLVFKCELSSSKQQIDLSNNVDGVYLVEILEKDKIVSRSKLILNR